MFDANQPDEREHGTTKTPIELSGGFRSFFEVVSPQAVEVILKKYRHRDGLGNDSVTAASAYWSAFTSLNRHFQKGEFADLMNPSELIRRFACIIYNRWRRKVGRPSEREAPSSRVDGELAGGSIMDRATKEDSPRSSDHKIEPSQKEKSDASLEMPTQPERDALCREFLVELDRALDVVREKFENRDSKTLERNSLILQRWFEAWGEATQSEIADDVGTTQATVSRVLEYTKYVLQQELKAFGERDDLV